MEENRENVKNKKEKNFFAISFIMSRKRGKQNSHIKFIILFLSFFGILSYLLLSQIQHNTCWATATDNVYCSSSQNSENMYIQRIKHTALLNESGPRPIIKVNWIQLKWTELTDWLRLLLMFRPCSQFSCPIPDKPIVRLHHTWLLSHK